MSDSDFECPNCGEPVPYYLTRCPRCNWNMYPSDDDEAEPGSAHANLDETHLFPASLVAWMGGVFAGWAAAGGLAFFVHLLVGRALPAAALEPGLRLLLYAANVLAALAGGALAALIGRNRGPGRERTSSAWYGWQGLRTSLLTGGPVGLLAALNALLFETRWRQVSPALLNDPYFMIMLLLTLSAGLDGALCYAYGTNHRRCTSPDGTNHRRCTSPDGTNHRLLAGRPVGAAGLAVPLKSESALYEDLLRRVGGDAALAERLVELESRRDPHASRMLCLLNAIERLARDRR